MPLSISAAFSFELEPRAHALLQFEAADLPDQSVIDARASITGVDRERRVPGEDALGERIWVRGEGLVEARYEASVAIHRAPPAWRRMNAVALSDLPAEAVAHLLDSRYCHPAQFTDFAESQFGAIAPAGARIEAIREWVAGHVRYAHSFSDAATTATDTFHAAQGACRDLAHLVITLARASSIPARYAACYAPGVTPQDFHAVAQVYLADPAQEAPGAWYIVDATGMADPAQTALIGVGRDAGDVSFVTSFGPMRFCASHVAVTPDQSAPSPGNDNTPGDEREQLG